MRSLTAAIVGIIAFGICLLLPQILERQPTTKSNDPVTVSYDAPVTIVAGRVDSYSAPDIYTVVADVYETLVTKRVEPPIDLEPRKPFSVEFDPHAVPEPVPSLQPSAIVKELKRIQLPEPDSAVNKEPLSGLFDAELEARMDNGKIRLQYTLTNISGRELEMVYGSGKQYDYWVYDESGDEVYRWSHDKAFIQVITNVLVGVGEQLVFEEEWPMLNYEGEVVSPGVYTIQFKSSLSPRSGTISYEELLADAVVEIRSE